MLGKSEEFKKLNNNKNSKDPIQADTSYSQVFSEYNLLNKV